MNEDGTDVAIGLYAQQDDGHSQQVGQEEACQLSCTEVLAQKFPNQFVHW